MGWPQISVIALSAMGFGIASVKHGQPAPNYSVGRQLFACGLINSLLYMGGFYS